MAKATKSNNIMGAVAYLLWFITGIVLLITEKKDPFVRFHAAQSTVVFGLLFIVGIVLGFIPFVGWLLMLPLMLVELLLWLFLMWKAYSGEQFQLPMIAGLVKNVEKSIKSS